MYNNFDEINQIMLNISKNKYSVGFCYNAGFQELHISAPKQFSPKCTYQNEI